METGQTVLLMRDKSKGNEASNYRPITCLPLTWKLLKSIGADEIYNHLENLDIYDLLPEEQKGSRRNSRGTLFFYINIKLISILKLRYLKNKLILGIFSSLRIFLIASISSQIKCKE